ncbi:TYRO protein tyrosine kinase-binding protein isoform X2 [Nerophis ophidion]|uniref:TYRO protein tyrosine kinase-binding protein isoform X2 n=1 Tax=Nerophis ophidion TaxID=159077 RepID=UPI002ADF5B18|nr:TYRO protein tyrosine kinase-binding protein isoform X2 [Nerophis ophidion]
MKDTICVEGSLFGSTGQECVSCYLISMQSVVGIIACDIILTVLIAISVFCFVTLHKRKAEPNVGSSVNEKTAESTESPYQIWPFQWLLQVHLQQQQASDDVRQCLLPTIKGSRGVLEPISAAFERKAGYACSK